METKTFIIELAKIVASMVVPLIGLYRLRTDLDRFAASRRAKDTGQPIESQIRRRWYHRLKGVKHDDSIRPSPGESPKV